MTRETAASLELITDAVSKQLRFHSWPDALRQLRDYHGFEKGPLPLLLRSQLDFLFEENGFAPDAFQIELVRVRADLSSEVHVHKSAYALCTILGQTHGAEPPVHAYAYRALAGNPSSWFQVMENERIYIPPGTPHGFTVAPGGVLNFLSVQSPPIASKDHDDYHKIDAPRPPFARRQP